MGRFLSILALFFFFWNEVHSQENLKNIFIKVRSEKGEAVSFVHLHVPRVKKSFLADSLGNASLSLESGSYEFVFSRVGFYSLKKELQVLETGQVLVVELKANPTALKGVEVKGKKLSGINLSAFEIKPVDARNIPSPFHDFSKALSSLPGVIANNELSSTYTVRGGNYDENLVYVNGMEVYRPVLIKSAEQEGLSFINPDLVGKVKFYSGGWTARYGNKLSSNLAVEYAKPEANWAKASISALGGSMALAYKSKKQPLSVLTGFRYKNAQGLLGTMDVQGEYEPRFFDWQAFVSYGLDERSSLEFLLAFSDNNYRVVPENRETKFGDLSQLFAFQVYFDGTEKFRYQNWQGGLRYNFDFSPRWKTQTQLTGLYAWERARYDIEGAYWLKDVTGQLFAPNAQATIVGYGTNYKHARNGHDNDLFSLSHLEQIGAGTNLDLEWGGAWKRTVSALFLDEYAFRVDDGKVKPDRQVEGEFDLKTDQVELFGQAEWNFDERHEVSAGINLHYASHSGELLVSPRIRYRYAPEAWPDTRFQAAWGLYQQPSQLKELISRQGRFVKDRKAQKSWHAIAGVEHDLEIWDRPFLLSGSAYYKYLWDLIPYEYDDIQILYRPQDDAVGYAAGVDLRLNGEFVPGVESWFSLGILSTKEKVSGGRWRRRPTDQRVTASFFFQDYLPFNDSFRVYLQGTYGSGFPQRYPGDELLEFDGDDFIRLDLGAFKIFRTKGKWEYSLGLEVLNVLGVSNAYSYTWVEDVNNRSYAVPNALSHRYLNVRLRVKWGDKKNLTEPNV
ncbi:MAG: TonB-dependent receptor [Cytophagales bacterium]|nr:TonB-dependent receptor [Cytophagales bacterium]